MWSGNKNNIFLTIENKILFECNGANTESSKHWKAKTYIQVCQACSILSVSNTQCFNDAFYVYLFFYCIHIFSIYMYMYLSATLNLEPSFSNSAITQSVIQGTPNEVIAKINYIMVDQTIQVHHTVDQHKQKQNNTT